MDTADSWRILLHLVHEGAVPVVGKSGGGNRQPSGAGERYGAGYFFL